MTRNELDDIESILVDIARADDTIDPIERLYRHIKALYKSQCEKKLGHKPLDIDV